jgi:hypothetical protein
MDQNISHDDHGEVVKSENLNDLNAERLQAMADPLAYRERLATSITANVAAQNSTFHAGLNAKHVPQAPLERGDRAPRVQHKVEPPEQGFSH